MNEQIQRVPDWRRDGPAAQQAQLPHPLRELHRSILRHFLDTGGPPDRTWIGLQCARLDLDTDEAVAALAAVELVHCDGGVGVAVAYPFSAAATGHRVRLATGVQLWAMCAIDALGVALLAGGDARISAADPSTGEDVEVTLRGGVWSWRPASTVVLMVHAGRLAPGAVCTCELVNFYATAQTATTHRDAHPELRGEVLDRDAALARAVAGFGGLLG